MTLGDTVIIKEVVYGDPKKYKVVDVSFNKATKMVVYLIESTDGERLARLEDQLVKVD